MYLMSIISISIIVILFVQETHQKHSDSSSLRSYTTKKSTNDSSQIQKSFKADALRGGANNDLIRNSNKFRNSSGFQGNSDGLSPIIEAFYGHGGGFGGEAARNKREPDTESSSESSNVDVEPSEAEAKDENSNDAKEDETESGESTNVGEQAETLPAEAGDKPSESEASDTPGLNTESPDVGEQAETVPVGATDIPSSSEASGTPGPNTENADVGEQAETLPAGADAQSSDSEASGTPEPNTELPDLDNQAGTLPAGEDAKPSDGEASGTPGPNTEIPDVGEQAETLPAGADVQSSDGEASGTPGPNTETPDAGEQAETLPAGEDDQSSDSEASEGSNTKSPNEGGQPAIPPGAHNEPTASGGEASSESATVEPLEVTLGEEEAKPEGETNSDGGEEGGQTSEKLLDQTTQVSTSEDVGNTEGSETSKSETDQIEIETTRPNVIHTSSTAFSEEPEEPDGNVNIPTTKRHPTKLLGQKFFSDDEIIGLEAARVAFTFRENLINLFGYLMYQISVDTKPEIYYYLYVFKTALDSNRLDVFKLIKVIPTMKEDGLNDQLQILAKRMSDISDNKYCQVKCTARRWVESINDVDFDKAVTHLGYNPLLSQVMENDDDRQTLKVLIGKLDNTPMYGVSYFSQHIVRILNEVLEKRTSMDENLIGYLLPFFPWPADDPDVVMALNILIHTLVDGKNVKLISCGTIIPKEMVGAPIKMLIKFLRSLANSKCNRLEKTAAQYLLQVAETQLAVPDYRNYFAGHYVEINRLWELLDIITYENYPPEIVLARNRIRRYVDKVIFFIAYPTFIVYEYNTAEEMLYAFLAFVIQETPFPPIEIKMSINALKSHLMFYIGPRKINYNLLLSVIDGFIAPDMNEYLIEQFLSIKAFVLDESVMITKILQANPTRKCTHLVSCYFEIFGILRDDSAFQEKVSNMIMPDCILRRFLNKQELPDNYKVKAVSLASLLEIIDYNQFQRETVLSAQMIKKHIQKTQEGLTIKPDRLFCTKHETLLDSLENLMKGNAKYPQDVVACVKAVVPALRFQLAPITHIDSSIMQLIASAWRSPFTDEVTATEMKRVESIINGNSKDLDVKLFEMNTHDCVDMLECYNSIAEYLNNINPRLDFKYRTEISPELYALGIGNVVTMTTKTIIDIVNAVQTHLDDDSELEAAKSYLKDFDLDLDTVLKQVNCGGQQVKPCFLLILEKFRFDHSMSHVEVNIVQYLLIPTTCDKRHCWWYPYDESGSTVINPLQAYMIYLLGYYSVSDVKSLHLQMDIDQIILYLNIADVEEVLSQFKIKLYTNNLEKLEKFLQLLMSGSLIDTSVQQSVSHVYSYITKNNLPDKLNIGNLIYLKKLFATLTKNKTVKVELDEIGINFIKYDYEVTEILETLFVKCFTLDKCLRIVKQQLSSPAYFSKPGSKQILQLLNPFACMDNKQICPWIGVDPAIIIPDVVIPSIIIEIQKPNISMIDKIAWIIVKDKILHNPDAIINIITVPPDGKPIDVTIMIEELIQSVETPKEIKDILLGMIKDDKKDLIVDYEVLGTLLEEMYEVTFDEAVKTQIKDLIEIIESNMAIVNNIFGDLNLACDVIGQCVENVFKYIVEKGLCDKPIPKELLELFHAKHCSKANCAWKVPQNIKKITLYKNRILQYLTSVMNEESTPFHIELDIIDVIDYLDETDVTEIIYSEVLCSKKISEKTLGAVILILQQHENTPHSVSVSIKNILNFVENGQPPSFLQVSNLKKIVYMLIEQTTDIRVKHILEKGITFFEKFKTEVTVVLEVSPIDCSTLQSCVDTLIVAMEIRKNEQMPDMIILILKPNICTPKTCPWLAQSLDIKIKQIESILLKELKRIQKDKTVPVHIKLDAQAFKKIIKQCLESMGMLPDDIMDKPDVLLTVFLKTINYDIITKHEMQYVKKDLEDFLLKGVEPSYMDVTVLLIFGELLKRITKDDRIKMDIEKKRAVIKRDVSAVQNIMMTCRVNCPNVRKCAESMGICLNVSPTKEEPHSAIVLQMIHPKRCTRITCPWLPPESREDLIAKLDDIKTEVTVKIANEEVAIIIRIMLKDFLNLLVIEKIERYLRGISKFDTEKLKSLLSFMRKDKKIYSPNHMRIIQKIYLYLKAGKVPRWLVSGDLPGLVRWLIELSQQPEIKEYMESGLNVIMKRKPEVNKELKICAVKCIELKSCLDFLHGCLQKSENIAALWLLQLLFPEKCDIQICPWMLPSQEPIENDQLPIPKPHVIYPDFIIIFFVEYKVLKHIILDLTNERTLIMIEAYTFLAESSLRRTTVINAKGSHKNYMIDYEYLKGFQRVGLDVEAMFNFATMQSIIVCLRYKNGNFRPLKFDFSKESVRDALKEIGSQQKPHAQKPAVTIVDKDDYSQKLILDVLDVNSLRDIYTQTIDNVMPYEYIALFFWPRKQLNEPWKSATIIDKSALEIYLRNLPGMDMANKETPIVLTSEGIISMDFDVNSVTIVEGIETAVNDEELNIYMSKHKKFMFYIPFPFQKNMIAIPVNLSDPYTLEVLKESNVKYPIESEAVTFYIYQTEDENESPIPIRFDFYGDVVYYLIRNLNNKPGQPGTGSEPDTSITAGGLNLVIIPINDEGDVIVLDLDNLVVRKFLIDQFSEKPQAERTIIINVPIAGGWIPVTLDPRDSIVIQVLKSLMENTLPSINPVSTNTVEGVNIILITGLDANYKVVSIVIQDTLSNKKALVSRQLEPGDIPFEINFGSGKVALPKERLFQILLDLPKVNLVGPTYTQQSNVLEGEVQIPIEVEGKYYYITLETNQQTVVDFLDQSAVTPDLPGITFLFKDQLSNIKQMTLPTGKKDLVSKMIEIAARLEIQPRRDAVLAILAPDKDNMGEMRSRILDLSNPNVYTSIEDKSMQVNSKSTTKGIYHYVDEEGEIAPIVLDYKRYDFSHFSDLEQETPLELKPLRLPSLEDAVPQIAFMVTSQTGRKVSVVLNPFDEVVWESLVALSAPRHPKHVPILINGPGDKQTMFYLNKNDTAVVEKLISLSSRSTLLNVPAKPIPLDGRSMVAVDLSKNKMVDTRDEKDFAQLIEVHKGLPMMEPLMTVLQPDGTGFLLRVDTRVYQFGMKNPVPNPKADSFMVVNPDGHKAIIVDVSSSFVSAKLLQMAAHEDQRYAEMMVFTDSGGQVQFIRLDTKNQTVINELWNLQQKTTPKFLMPFLVVPKFAKPHYVFTVIDERGNNEAVILDVTKESVKRKLIAMWDASTKGVPFRISDRNGNRITIYFDLSRRDISKNMLSLMAETEAFSTPIVTGGLTEKNRILKIPITEGNKKFLVNCNVTSPVVIDGLLRIPGQNIIDPKGAAFMLKDDTGHLTTMYLDLSNELVVRALKRVCPHKTMILDPSKTLVLDMKNRLGERQTQVINLDTESVVNYLLQRGKISHRMDTTMGVEFPLVDFSGKTKIYALDMQDTESVKLLNVLNDLSLGHNKFESFSIPDSGGSFDNMIIFGGKGPILVNQGNEELLDRILSLSMPNNRHSVKVSFTTSSGEIKYGYFDVNDIDLMDKLKKLTDQYFQQPQFIPPLVTAHHQVIKIPCVTKQHQRALIFLDITDPRVIEKFKDQSVLSAQSGKYSMKVSIVKNGGVVDVYQLDTTNFQTCDQLKLVAFYQCYSPADGSLLILRVPSEIMPVVILDLANDRVFAELEALSKKTDPKATTHMAIVKGSGGKYSMLRFNVNNKVTVNKFLQLAEYTPYPTVPVTTASPYGTSPFIVFTAELSTGDVKHILLNLGNPRVMVTLEELAGQTHSLRQPLEVSYEDASGKQKSYVLDASDDAAIMKLYELTVSEQGLFDALISVPQKNAFMQPQISLLLENPDGTFYNYDIDVTDLKRMQEFQKRSRKIPKKTPGVILYFKNMVDLTVAVRVRPDEIVGQVSESNYKPTLSLNKKRVIVLTYRGKGYKVKACILNTMDPIVVKTLVELTESTPVDQPYSAGTILTRDGKLIPIRLNLNQRPTQNKLQGLQKQTPAPMVPVVFPSPFGTEPLVAMTVKGDNGETVPILLDLNNPNTIRALKEMRSPKGKPQVTIILPSMDTFKMDMTDAALVKDLIKVASNPTLMPALVTSHITPILMLPIYKGEKVINVYLDTDDDYTSQYLIDYVKGVAINPTEPLQNGVNFYIDDDRGGQTIIVLDTSRQEVVDFLLALGKRMVSPTIIRIKPATGPQELIITTVPTSSGFIPVTIDANNPRVIALLIKLSEPVKQSADVSILTVTPIIGPPIQIIIDRNRPDLREKLNEITMLSPIIVTPIKIIPANGKMPLLNVLVPNGQGFSSFTVDLNDKATLDKLGMYSNPDNDGVTSIEYITPTGETDHLNLDFTNEELVNVVSSAQSSITLKPRPNQYPIISIHDGANVIEIDCNDVSVVEKLVELSNEQQNSNSKLTEIELKDEYGFPITVHIDLQSPKLKEILKETTHEVEVPNVVIPGAVINVSPVRIKPPQGTFPLLMAEFPNVGPITVDVNDEKVNTLLKDLPHSENDVPVILHDDLGNVKIFNLNPYDRRVQDLLKRVPRHPIFSFRSEGKLLPTLTIKTTSPQTFDLSQPADIEKLKRVSKRSPSAYQLQIPLPNNDIILYLEPGDVHQSPDSGSTTQVDMATFTWPSTTSYPLTEATLETEPDDWTDFGTQSTFKVQDTTTPFFDTFPTVTFPNIVTTSQTYSTPIQINYPNVTQTTAIGGVGEIDVTLFPTNGQTVQNPQNMAPIYWLSINITNKLTNEIRMYTFDVGKKNILDTLLIYSQSLPANEQILSIEVQLPLNTFVLNINPYDVKTFELFEKLTLMSTGKPSLLLGFQKPQLWWTLTVTDQYNRPLKIELDVANPSVLQKVIELSNMYNPSSGTGTIIKGQLPNGQTFELILDLNSSTTIQNLIALMEESKGGISKPLKPIGDAAVGQGSKKQLITFVITVSGLKEQLKIILDVANANIIKRLKALSEKHKNDAGSFVIQLDTGKETLTVIINPNDIETIKELVAMTVASTGDQSLAIVIENLKDTNRYMPVLITIEVNDGRETIPVSIDIADKEVLEVLFKLQASDPRLATTIKFTDSSGKTHTLNININDRQVFSVLMALSVPTITPAVAPVIKLLTFILVPKDNYYTAIQLDLADRRTVLYFIQLAQKYQDKFQTKNFVEVRDETGQYIPISVDFSEGGFIKELSDVAVTSRRHSIDLKVNTYLVVCTPNSNQRTYSVFKTKLNPTVVDRLKQLPASKSAVTISVVDEINTFRLDPSDDTFIGQLAQLPGVGMIQPSKVKRMLILYVTENTVVTPIYLDLTDIRTMNKLIEMHNAYANMGASQSITIVRYLSKKETRHMFLHINSQIALRELNKLSVSVAGHKFMRQKLEKIMKIKVPQANGQTYDILLNLADPLVIEELKMMSIKGEKDKKSTKMTITDAFGETFTLYLNFFDKVVVSKLMRLSLK